jgi:single-stranded-DNA-specific exonuclease
MKKRWIIKPSDQKKAIDIAKQLDVSEILGKLLELRGITDFDTAKEFFRPQLNELYDPFLMKDMDKAVERLQEAINNKQKIMIYGDYDVDGTTSVSMTYHFLSQLTDNIEYYIPDRYAEGYGVSKKGIEYAASVNVDLMITLDCGIKAIDQVEMGNKKNIDFIICDHHQPGDEMPRAVAVLDPKRPDCDYPFKELCGCGVGFKLLQAYCIKEAISPDKLYPYLDMVALAIGADIVPIVDENRIMAYYGLQQINSHPRMGLKALLQTAKANKHVTVTDLVFIAAPRINAAGRIKSARKAVELLISEDEEIALDFSKDIEEDNLLRRDLDRTITKEGLEMIENNPEWQEKKSTVVYDADWHKGVIGIVASRLIESYYKPTIVFTKSGDIAAGSARSVKGFDLYKALEQCSDYLIQFGGHKYAAGMTIEIDKIDAFREKFEEVVTNIIDPACLIPEISIDMELDFADITPKLYRIIMQMAPFGPGNMMPVFVSRNVRDFGYSKAVGGEGEHLKLFVRQNGSEALSGIGFNMGKYYPEVKTGLPFDIVYTIEENTWNNKTSLQLRIKDLKFL